MEKKAKVHELVNQLALEVLDFIKGSENLYSDRWVPAADIKRKLDLNFVAVPIANNPQRGEKGWFFASLARLLEDQGLLEYRKDASRRAYYRSR